MTRRYYMSGIDWVMAALDTLNKTRTCAGNHSQIVLHLSGCLSKQTLFDLVEKKISSQPFYSGKLKRSKRHLAPYWKSCPRQFTLDDIFEYDLDALDLLETHFFLRAAAPFPDDRVMLAFDLLHQADNTFVIMRFDHRMFDARGAEGLLQYLLDEKAQRFDTNTDFPEQSSGLDNWKSRFLSGQVINRFLLSKYDAASNITGFDTRNFPAEPSHCFGHVNFSKDETLAIEENVLKQAGYLMNGIFYLNCACEAVLELMGPDGLEKMLMVPINVDTRQARFETEKLFFNQLSFMFFKISGNSSRKERILSLKTQFMEQTKNQILHHFENASMLMRIAPLNFLSRFMTWRMKAQPASFSFSYVGNQAFFLEQVKNIKVRNLFHVPVVPVHPGAGIFFTRFNGMLNMTVSGFDHTLGKEKLNALTRLISQRLTGES